MVRMRLPSVAPAPIIAPYKELNPPKGMRDHRPLVRSRRSMRPDLGEMPMKAVAALCTIAAGLLPAVAGAEGLTFGGGAAITSNALSDGLSDTANGPAFQPFL